MPKATNIFTTIRTEGALLPPDLLQRISEGENFDGLTAASYHRPGEKLNEAINRSWNALQGAWANFKSAQERLPEDDLGTTITRERWLLPLFRELDYGRLQTATAVEIDGRSYPISHGWEYVPIHLVSYRVDLDTRTKGVAGASSASPHSLVQIFLNRSDDNLWGFVSNGYKLRVLRDNLTLTRQAYVEFDLEAMMDGEVYSDFVLLWLLCHQSRVEGEKPTDCWLEQWMKAAEEQGTRALEQLRGGVEAAIEALGLGFIEHPANAALRDRLTDGDLNGQDYYRQLLRIVYRLLFLFVAEDRDLLLDPDAGDAERECYEQFYSTGRLRRMAESFKGTRHPDLFEGLRLVMRLLSGESNGAGAALGLVPLGSFLFSDRAVADVIDCQISNQHLLDAVRVLSLVYDDTAKVYRSVDYKNLGPEELGSVYESLLELHPQINIPGRRFALATAGGNERKTTGSYYTPTSLINALLDSALDPVLDDASRKGESAILNLKVCDPACGSGHFLIAAANRMAKRLAEVRTGEEEPTPEAVKEAKRDVIGHCIYGVDINPMAVELCKVNLWMEALEPGKPLSFLDHRIQVGNSLLGTTPKLMADGIPDDAFKPIEGDDKKSATAYRKKNREERKQRKAGTRQMNLFGEAPGANYQALSYATRTLDQAPDDTLQQIRQKEQMYSQLANDPEYIKARMLADAWCAAFVWEKQPGEGMALTDLVYRQLEANPLSESLGPLRETVVALADRYQFFHWHVAFPDVFAVPDDVQAAKNTQTGWNGGFDVVLGNPPWERIKIQEKEWFAERSPEIASAPNAAARRRMIADLEQNDPFLLAAFVDDKRKAEGESHFVRMSDRYPLCGRGDVNTYSIFAETSRHVINGYGRVGMIVPSGIATDDTTKFFFQDLMQTRSLASLYDFENREGLFPAVDSRMKFSLITMTGWESVASEAEFVFFALNVGDLKDDWRHFTLSAEDIAALNPNTGTMATFRSQQDAEITKAIYKRVPVLIQEEPLENPWGISFLRMFDMSNDSDKFRTREELEAAEFTLEGNHFIRGDERYLPLYEGRLGHQYNHRFAVQPSGEMREVSSDEVQNPNFVVEPQFFVSALDFDERTQRRQVDCYTGLLGHRRVARDTDERTAIACIFPWQPASYGWILSMGPDAIGLTILNSNYNSFIFDYLLRNSLSQPSIPQGVFQQLPAIPPHTDTPALLDFIVPRVLELTYTAWDLQAFAQDVGYDGPPFIWDEERRFLMRCELDALYFHLYQISRDDVDYIMETFPIVKRKDEASYGSYRTKDTILSMFDEMAALSKLAVPAPKDESATYKVPDVSQWETWLSPGPADESVAHPSRGA
ncbi:N-6 DNA methylase [Phototrophicus methaneseepsis]|uniref:site-specific DNA-methyltransferase (adenine-specific) n=1 Tax=Phototrophicus methaneseepsis TaxID=2710758 RepID=A0A7S8EB62_9CHLR|nr:N-6 DNA methylase [Phototrophicus methaneseepsis]QPC83629.1 N-6 DNA methylase [Phototrophicus methaneseepsis]